MSVLILGGDKNISIEKNLKGLGVEEIQHWVGRKNSETHKELPQNIDVLVMHTKFLNHNMMKKFKNIAKKRDLPVIYSHSNSVIYTEINKLIS
jgi:hypothetical protein